MQHEVRMSEGPSSLGSREEGLFAALGSCAWTQPRGHRVPQPHGRARCSSSALEMELEASLHLLVSTICKAGMTQLCARSTCLDFKLVLITSSACRQSAGCCLVTRAGRNTSGSPNGQPRAQEG